MAIEIISAEDVLKLSRKNPERNYPNPKTDRHRLQPFAQVASSASFRFGSDARIFTAGSCFARNVERSLRKMDYHVISSGDDFYNPFPERQTFHRFNKYTIHSILNEFEWALGERPMDSASLLCPVKDGLYCDTQTLADSLVAPLEEMVRFRDSFNATFARVAHADVVMLTLGLVECWRDNDTGEYLNRFPGATAIKKNPGRFSLHVLDHDEILDGLCRTYDVIAKHNKDFKMLVTVSPVPLDRTFRQQDILAANCYSKSVQRAAVESFVQSRPADYFPSYETVTLSDMAYAWGDHDFRHVRGDMVDRLMGKVLERYTDVTERQSAQSTRGLMTAYLAAGDPPKAREALEAHIAAFDLPLDLMQLSAELDLREGRAASAATTLKELVAAIHADPEIAEDLTGQKASIMLTNATQLLEHCQRIEGKSLSAGQMSDLRAERIVTTLLDAAPEDEELIWLKGYLGRIGQGSISEAPQQDQKAMLIEAAALARLRALGDKDIDAARQIVDNALETLGVSEALSWELAVRLRNAEHLEEALDHFARIGHMGGSKAVPAVKFALPLARRLKKHDLFAELAEKVAGTL